MIRDLGHDVEEAASGPQALARLNGGLKVDVVITDYKMPGMDGAELTRQIERTHPEVAILLITGYTGPTDDVYHLPRLAKPFGRAEIATAIDSLFEGDGNVVRFPSGQRRS